MSESSIILSPYTFLFEEDNKYYLFSTESLFFSKIEESLYITLIERAFDSLSDESKEILIGKRIIIKEDETHTFYNHCMTRHLTSAYADDTMVLIVVPSTACNFSCPYCFEPKKNPKIISIEVEDKLIEYINKQSHISRIVLVWYGGEPLLAKESILRIYGRVISETDKEIVSHEIISNAFLVDEEVIEIFRQTKINKIQITLDGVKERHDSTRFLKNSHSQTFDTIQRNIEKIAKDLPKVHISIRVNITKDNWSDFISLYHEYHGEPWHKNIGIYPGFIKEDGVDGCRLKHKCFQISDLLELHLKYADKRVNVNLFPSISSKGCMLQSKCIHCGAGRRTIQMLG